MRSMRPDRWNAWPHDMVLAIDDSPSALLELLWVREAWHLTPEGDVPPPLADTPGATAPADPGAPAESADPASRDTTGWAEAWARLWSAGLAHAADPSDQHEMLATTQLSVTERIALLHHLFGPSWHDEFDDATLGEPYQEWNRRHIERLLAARRTARLDEEPERICLDALVPAWRAGLLRVVVLPCRGSFTRTIGPHALLATAETRDDPARYRAALAAFESAVRTT